MCSPTRPVEAGHRSLIRLVYFDGREVGFDLAVVVPVHGGQAYVGRSPGLGDALGFVPTDERTLQSKASPDIFVIGKSLGGGIPCGAYGLTAEVADLVHGLEQQYDAAQEADGDELLAEGEEMPTADELAAQFEQFLADQQRGDSPDR